MIALIIASLLVVNNLSSEISINKEVGIIEKYCKQTKIYNSKTNYKSIVNNVHKLCKVFPVDEYLVLSVAICESELNHWAMNTNKNGSIDAGLMQINTIWNGVIFKNDCDTNIMMDEYYNLYAGIYVLNHYIKKYNGDLYRAVWAYNGLCKHNEYYPKKILKVYYQLNLMR